MYKLRIINYQPYEYEILQDLLNQMAKQGYHTKQLSFFTLFKKTNETSQYRVDLFSSNAKSHYNKNIDKDRFISNYLDHDYKEIYHRKELYVFKGTKDLPPIPWNKRKDVLSSQSIRNQLMWALTCIVITLAFTYYSIKGFSYDTFLTYGSLFIYIGLVGMFFGFSYYLLMCYKYKNQFKNQLENGQPQIPFQHLKKQYQSFHIYMIVMIVLFISGFVEDSFNPKDITLTSHPQITLQEISHIQDTNSTYIQKNGFFINHYYRYFETTNDESNMLLVEEYNYNDENKAKQLLEYFYNDPSKYSCDQLLKQDDHIAIGQLENENIAVFIQKKNSLYIISKNNEFTQKQIQTIINYY